MKFIFMCILNLLFQLTNSKQFVLRLFYFGFILWISTFHFSTAQQIEKAQSLYALGEVQFNDQNFQEAIHFFSQAIALKADYTDAYYYRGIAKEELQDLEGAFIDYSICLEWNSTFGECLFRRAQLLFRIEKWNDAIIDFNNLLKLPPGETHDILYRSNEYEIGVNRIITIQGATDLFYNYLGLISMETAEFGNSLLYFDSAIALYKRDADYYVNRAQANQKLGKLDAARLDYEAAIKIAPAHGMAQQYLAALLRETGDITTSEQYLTEAITLNPNRPLGYLERAYYRMESGNYKGAIADYTAALLIDSLNTEVWINRGLANEKMGALQAAYADYHVAIRIDEELEAAWLGSANVLVQQNKFAKAIEDYTIAITCFPEYGLAYYNRALVHHRMGNKVKACNDLLKAKQLGQPVPNRVESSLCPE